MVERLLLFIFAGVALLVGALLGARRLHRPMLEELHRKRLGKHNAEIACAVCSLPTDPANGDQYSRGHWWHVKCFKDIDIEIDG